MISRTYFAKVAELRRQYMVPNYYYHKWTVLYILTLFVLVVMLYSFLTDIPITYDSEISKAIETIRRSSDEDAQLLRPLHSYVSLMKVVPEYHISYCAVQGVYEFMAENMFCYLYDTEYFVENNITFEIDYPAKRPCWKRNEFENEIDVNIHLNDRVDHLFIYKEPFLRFTMSYINECIMKDVPEFCFQCTKFDLTCFAMKLKSFLMYPPRLNYQDNTVLMFLKVVPQTWNCNILETYRNTTFIQYGLSRSERMQTSQKIYEFMVDKVPQHKADYIRTVLQNEGKTAWYGWSTGRKYIETKFYEKLLNDKNLEYILLQIYKTDLEVFDLKEFGPRYVHRILTEPY